MKRFAFIKSAFTKLTLTLAVALASLTAGAQERSGADSLSARSASTVVSEYAYDANGNMTRDLNRGISEIQYNCLNLPSLIAFVNGDTVRNEYAANGEKLRTVSKIDGVTTRTDYRGNAIYINGELRLLMNEAGYVSMPDKKFHFFIRDYQGNIRVVADEDGNVEEVNEYYPSGALMSSTAPNNAQPYKYNGKELERANGLDWYDYGARRYDPILGRFTTMDPMAEKYPGASPYGYCLGNPVKHVDPSGRFVESVWDALSFTMGVKSFTDNIRAGNFGSAALDAVGIVVDGVALAVPVVPGGAGAIINGARAADKVVDAATEIDKAVDAVNTTRALKAVHGNSKASTKAQHAYDVINTESGKIVKTGVSGGKIRKDGKSYRAERQVRKWNKEEGEGKYESTITHEEPAGEGARDKILEYEKQRANELKKLEQLNEGKHQIP